MPRRDLPLNAYVTSVVLAGGASGAAVVLLGRDDFPHVTSGVCLLLALCALLSQLNRLRLVANSGSGEINAASCFIVALMLAGGPVTALVWLVLTCLVADVLHRKAAHKIAFNLAQYAVAVAVSGLVLILSTDLPQPGAPHLRAEDLPGILAAGLTFVVVNTGLVATAIALADRLPVAAFVRTDLREQGAIGGLALGVAPLIVLAAELSPPAVTLAFLPLLALQHGGRQTLAKEQKALHDVLTRLPNRELLHDRVGQAIRAGRRDGSSVVVMLMDLDRFKQINDTLGHHHGDELLKQVARRLDATLRESDTVARLGGDEFAVLLPQVARAGDAAVVAQQLLAALREPFVVDGLTLEVGASIGMALHPGHGDDGETLLRHADVAMYEAKRSGRGFALFEARLEPDSPRRLVLAGQLRDAIARGELELHYQPKAELTTGRIVGVEVLARWQHSELGLVGPAEFVPLAEQTGLTQALTARVLDGALGQARAWADAGLELTLAVNLSPRAFLDAGLTGMVAEALARAGIPAGRLELELTEATLMAEGARVAATLERLRALGVVLAVDDFGAGSTSLAALKRLPLDVLKIDKGFVRHMATDPTDAAMVRSVVELAHNLGMIATAEGVESEVAWRQLEELGCDLAQGYHVARPLPAAAVPALVAAREAAGALRRP